MEKASATRDVFRPEPDIILRRGGKILAIIGVSRSEVYQLMAYGWLYPTGEMLQLYPEAPENLAGDRRLFGMAGDAERLAITTVYISCAETLVIDQLRQLCGRFGADIEAGCLRVAS